MATKKRAKVPAPITTPDDTARTEAGSDVETARDNSDVQRADSYATPAIESVEALDPATPRVDIENGVAGEAGDIERGPT